MNYEQIFVSNENSKEFFLVFFIKMIGTFDASGHVLIPLSVHELTRFCYCEISDDILSCYSKSEENKIHQRYYQWIPLLFLVQAAISYMPAYIWKVAECGLLHKLCDNLGK